MKHIFLVSLISLLASIYTAATTLPQYAVKGYTIHDGLGHGLVNDILQDHNGILWFASWNGLSRFDGYNFYNYKSQAGNKVLFNNNRILSVKEDSLGFLWVYCYDNSIYRFDPWYETFLQVRVDNITSADQIRIFSNGIVWFVPQNGKAVRVQNCLKKRKLKFSHFAQPAIHPFKSVNNVFLDQQKKEWILTDNGVYLIKPGHKTLQTIIKGDNFHSAAETDGQIILGTTNGKIYIYDKNRKQYRYKQLETHANITEILKSNTGSLLYITDSDGFFIGKDDQITHVSKKSNPELADNHIESVYIDSKGMIWLSHQVFGASVYNPSTHKFTYFLKHDEYGQPLTTETGMIIFEDKNQILWVHPKGGGLSYYDRENNRLVPFNITQDAVPWRCNDRCFCITTDRQGNLWMSTQSKGLNKITFQHNFFHLSTLDTQDPNSSQNEVRAIFVDKEQRTWVGTRNMELIILDKDKKVSGRLSLSGKIVSHESADTQIGKVYNIFQDNSGSYWISTKGNGIYRLVPQGRNTFKISQFRHSPANPYSLSSNDIYFVYQDKKGRIWIATYGNGINLVDTSTGKIRFINHNNRLKNYPIRRYYKTRHITEDIYDRIWISTTAGVLVFDADFSKVEDIEFLEQYRVSKDNTSLSNNDVHMIKCLPSGRIFAATFGGGLDELVEFKSDKAVFRSYSQNSGLVADIIYTIQDDHAGNLWLATEKGLIKFNLKDKSFEHYDNDLQAFNIQFSEGVGTFDNRQIQLGTNRGIFYFNPDEVFKNTFIPPIFLSSLNIDNKEVTPNDSTRILNKAINETRIVKIPHTAHIVSLKYSALDMSNTEDIQYAYMLEGFDKEYRIVNDRREAIYTNLPHGKYVFRIKSTNSEGVWVDNERTLDIEVLPSFWETPYARILYVLTGILILILVLRIYTIFYKLKDKALKEELISQFKVKLFTDISHELRTPLTLIIGPLESILQKDSVQDETKRKLKTIKHNCDRMLNLVSQILDFNKVQNNKMKLYVQETDLLPLIDRILQDFYALAEKRNIALHFEHSINQAYVWCDVDKIERIIYNLLSNAFKYTPDDKNIYISIEETESAFIIGIKDEGIGISRKSQKKIFERFESNTYQDFMANPSIGIGLSLAKELVELHKGTIGVESETGKGSCFTFSIPKGKNHFNKETEFILNDSTAHDIRYPIIRDENEECKTINPDKSNDIMLIVEDNDELREFIKELFSSDFQIIEACNGSEGLEQARKYIPDIIISDIMMPYKDGIQMLQELRQDITVCHIPTILLTAKADIESRLKGLETGSDAYIEKPFNVSHLQACVSNLLAQRKRLQEYYLSPTANKTDPSVPKEEITTSLSSKDIEFLEKLTAIMEREISNPDLSVDTLVEYFNFSRTIFFRKLKSLTGKSPITYIKDIRMKKAAQLLREKEFNVAETAYKTGFSDPHYFSKSFKQYYGVSPTEYQENNKQAHKSS